MGSHGRVETVKKFFEINWILIDVVEFKVIFVKCLCGISGLEGVKLSFTPAPY